MSQRKKTTKAFPHISKNACKRPTVRPMLEQLEARETPDSLYNPLFGTAFLSLDQLDVSLRHRPRRRFDLRKLVPGGAGSTQGGSTGGTGGTSQPPPDNFTPADPAAAAATVNQNANLFDSTLDTDDAAFAANVAAAVGGSGGGGAGGGGGVGAAVVIGLPTPSAMAGSGGPREATQARRPARPAPRRPPCLPGRPGRPEPAYRPPTSARTLSSCVAGRRSAP